MKPTKAIDLDTETTGLLDTLGYLRNGSEIWTMVPKDFDIAAHYSLSGLHFECSKPDNPPFEILSGDVIQRLVDEGYVRLRSGPDGNNANN